MIEKVHINISLFAGLLVTIISIAFDIPFLTFAFRLALTLSLFYIMGSILKHYLKTKIFTKEDCYFMEEDDQPNPKEEVIEENNEEASEEATT